MTEEEMQAIDYHAQPSKTRDKKRAERKAEQAKVKEKARQMLAGGMSVRDVAKQTGLSKSSVQRLKGNE